MAIELFLSRVWGVKRSWLPPLLFVLTIYFFWAINIPDRYVFHPLDATDVESLVITLLVAFWGWGIIYYSSRRLKSKRARHLFLLNFIFITPALALGAFYYVSHDVSLLASAFLSLDVPLALILFNGWCAYFFRSGHPVKTLIDEAYEPSDEIRIVGKIGQRKYVLSPVEVLGFQKDGIVYCYTRNGNRTVVEKSLTALQEQWEGQGFFRLNRQHLIHFDSVGIFRSMPNKSIEVQLTHLPRQTGRVIVSRHRASQFRKWMSVGVGIQ